MSKKNVKLEAVVELSEYKDKQGLLRSYANVYVIVNGLRLQLKPIDYTTAYILKQYVEAQ